MENPIVGPERMRASKVMGTFYEFYRMMEEAGLTFRDLQCAIDSPKFRKELVEFWTSHGKSVEITSNQLIAIEYAQDILGSAKVLTADQAAKAWDKEVPKNAPIRYSKAVLRECADQNQNKAAGTDWRLVYVFGQSLRQQREMKGTDPKHQPCFYNTDWRLKKEEDEWANQSPESGYYLIDFNGRWGRTSWDDQKANIASLGSDYERAHEAVIAEAILSIFQTTGERLLNSWLHWGRNRDSYGLFVYVGCFGQGGLFVYYYCPDWLDDGALRVCVSRKFQS